jgi:hypothetical protein
LIQSQTAGLSNEAKQRWYCYKDDQVWLGIEQRWVEPIVPPSKESQIKQVQLEYPTAEDKNTPAFVTAPQREDRTAIYLGIAGLVLLLLALVKAYGDMYSSCEYTLGRGNYVLVECMNIAWRPYFIFHPEIIVIFVVGLILLVLAIVIPTINAAPSQDSS